MKLRYLYSIMCIFSLLALSGCREEEAVQTSEGTRTVTINLGIAMSRAEEDDVIAQGEADDMSIWIYDQDGKSLQYKKVDNPKFTGVDIAGNPIETVTMDFDITDVEKLQFRVLMNTDNINIAYNNTSLTLDATTSMEAIDGATFTLGTTALESDNKVPMYGKEKDEVIISNKRDYNVEIEVERAVSKLELFFTKESEKSDLAITEITLKNIPDKGFLAKEATTDDALTYSTQDITLFTGSENIDKYLSEDIFGDFSTKPENFTSITLSQPYLLENPYNTVWSDNGKTDYEFPQPEEADEKAYVVTVSYTLNNTAETRSFVLPEVKRNIWNKIFVRVNDNGELIIQYKALPWDKVVSSIGYAPQHVNTSSNPFADKASYDEFIKGNNYVLFPIETYKDDRTNTQELFSYIYQNPQAGDNEARLCIITRPTYDEAIDDKEHWALKAGSAGARYMFMLTGPEGATWEAHLTNEEDFSFSTTEEDDFKGSEYESDGNINKVTHGIARQKPYIIQIIANHLYTGYDPGMDGSSTIDGFDNDGYDQYENYSEAQWEELFEDTYLTDWGREHQNEVVETDFYITVKLTDGSEYKLTINPSFKDNSDIKNEKFPFLDKRRFAGTDTDIWIRHLRAQYGWRNLECLARDLKENINDDPDEPWNKAYEWTVNPYWNPEHDEDVWK